MMIGYRTAGENARWSRATLLASAIALMPQFGLAQESAALVLQGGRVHTPDGVSEAVAVDGSGLIIALGTTAEIASHVGADTKVIELNGRAVLPGLSDLHTHAISAGSRQGQCNFPASASMKEVQDAVAACVKKHAPGEWILGGSWDSAPLGEMPTRQRLDEVAPDNPVMLRDTSGHGRWANSAALKAVGYDKATPDPEDGIIERDAEGNPTGLLLERAGYVAQSRVPAPDQEQVDGYLAWALHEMLSYGVTSLTEASAGSLVGWEKELNAWAGAADSGALKQRVRLCMTYRPAEAERAEQMLIVRNHFTRDRLSLDCVKLFLDGVPTEGRTAAMLDPYAHVEGGADHDDSHGMMLIPQDQLDALVTRFDEMGLAVKVHATGDASVRASLHAIEAARKTNGDSGLMHSVAHSNFVTVEDIARGKEIGATFDVSPYLWYPAPINDSARKAVGDERMKRIWPVRELIDSGALVVPGSDWPVSPSVNPWIAIETLVSRQQPGGSEATLAANEAITLEEAMDLFTLRSARQRQISSLTGSLEVGKAADLIVVDRDPFEIPVPEIHKTRVDYTIVAGEIAFQR